MVVDAWLTRAAAARPAAPAVNGLTYAELEARARRVALDGAGPGTSVAIRLPAGEDFAVALHAVWLRGATAVVADAPADLVVDALELGEPWDGAASHDLDATAVVLHTSGSTGAPKPVRLTFGNLLWSALGSAVALGVGRRDRWICALPLNHVGGLSIVVRSAIYGTAATVLPGWDTERVAHEIRTGATLVSVVPTTLARLLDAGLDHPRALRHALLGGAPIPPVLLERAAAAGVRVTATYGLTEAASQVATDGVPLFCTRVSLAEDGEILVSGPTVAPGAGSPLATGDLGAWRPDGRLAVVGRKADTIITGGENVAPAEVEAVLEAHPAVAEAAVLGRPDPEWGEAVVAKVVLRDGASATPEELREHAAGRLARFKVPKEIRCVAVLPRTDSGKLRRGRLEWYDQTAD